MGKLTFSIQGHHFSIHDGCRVQLQGSSTVIGDRLLEAEQRNYTAAKPETYGKVLYRTHTDFLPITITPEKPLELQCPTCGEDYIITVEMVRAHLPKEQDPYL